MAEVGAHAVITVFCDAVSDANVAPVLSSHRYCTALDTAVQVKSMSALVAVLPVAGAASVGAAACSMKVLPADQGPSRPSASRRLTRHAYGPAARPVVGAHAANFVVAVSTRFAGENCVS